MCGMPSRLDLRLMAALGVIAVAVAATQTVAGLDTGMLLLMPALVLALPLLTGRYLGEDTLAGWKAAFVPRRRRAAVVLAARLPHGTTVRAPHGGALLAAGLARRGPPRVALPSV